MDTLSLLTIHLARAYGMVVVAVALAALVAPARMAAAIAEFGRSPGLILLSAIVAVILGVAMVSFHSRWSDFPAILVSLLGWAVLVKGIVLLAAPDALLKLGGDVSRSHAIVRVWGVVALILGVAYLLIGFLARATLSI